MKANTTWTLYVASAKLIRNLRLADDVKATMRKSTVEVFSLLEPFRRVQGGSGGHGPGK